MQIHIITKVAACGNQHIIKFMFMHMLTIDRVYCYTYTSIRSAITCLTFPFAKNPDSSYRNRYMHILSDS
jgi:hypothetical protein